MLVFASFNNFVNFDIGRFNSDALKFGPTIKYILQLITED